MVFKRRDRRPVWRILVEFFWPRGGWGRAARYIQHRLHRLPDPPEKIGRGVFAGVFTAFTPLYGLHFVLAALIAKSLRGNILAALLATFFGNPLTYVPIAFSSLRTGYWFLGIDRHEPDHKSVLDRFAYAGGDLWHNLVSWFTGEPTNWSELILFYDKVFYPYLIGCILPGITCGLVCYYLTVPVIRAYQSRRRGALKSKLAALKSKQTRAGGGNSKE